MSIDETWFRCTLCGLTFDLKSVAQVHIKHNHEPETYDEIAACIEELEDLED